ncbi:anion permease [Rahnella sp. AA]|uniref:DASS family sodium-coupled anion symporter n=1 Tax=Rahnella sp. AA TaxID=2057180 RepID=UPI000C3333AF|nr:DASS family sodium-coupled anion symporter [Rahnella sp. AA]PKE32413.1 anion permease [Rahnella sp. AA]
MSGVIIESRQRVSPLQAKWIKIVICVLVGAVIWNIPIPNGYTAQNWHLFAIFFSTAFGFMLQPVTLGVVTLISLSAASVLGVLDVKGVLVGYSADVVWLIVAAFLFSRGLIKTGLGNRIAYALLQRFGSSPMRLGYTLAISDVIISFCVPSATARCGGIMFPIVRSISEVSGSKPGSTAKKLGAYLVQTVVQVDSIAACLTLTGQAGNLLIVAFASKIAGIEISWSIWAMAALMPGLISLVGLPWFIHKICPPEAKYTPETREVAHQSLQAMGKMSLHEKILCVILTLTVLGWATSGMTKISATVIALSGVCLMLLSEVIRWKDVTEESGAWDTLVWLGGMYGLADNLSKSGFFKVFADWVQVALAGMPAFPVLVILISIYVFSAYFFAGGIPHMLVMYPAFITVGIAVGAPPMLVCLLLAFSSSLYQAITHYSSGPAAIFFAGGYIGQREWWKLGFIVTLTNVLIWSIIGAVWWKVLGLW